ncbi:MAG: glycosyl transferase family 2 [Candidatus Raymondbacteria bacterium RifOxyA12_full_50_37]|uniref:Glycosyl transferase family 2 n=1 Tax=Candidatus Raymondbacteria bacterium RIFOXYD12_FULL_49_13 TaxID=1817890 RepID=A0A1F7FGG5_UNCRA|nr:MAG: glycosyl transferase family 2 [Candidatus Raymondbacteria bacterium RifOxyB12_full_50_8]OGJ91620.1 MAG: glycosyl transferase family 2 [Candidatus Raymondbacteria bacterium RifOxyA12_full_50_37]OGJ92926.1 MAG: glycosyl transferase family 2 [Candidatus Raymondbacteria bacterium RIFOXYA2_FULL_49_16]OGJ94852.1 MAG: glycosyl transferase family 2 [Candidatus Raymondbacteria bacterium RifOxyC12_full_50_8]OGK05688.1 MAG: glycosyl transferase family 2 [Candidatus Raymondbacteria bacterium RIFOXY
MKSVSIVIPFLNESESLRELYQRITVVVRDNSINEYEIIFVNDGSTDNSLDIVRALAKDDAQVKCIGFRKNYGKAAALSEGFKAARYGYVVTMDADLQDDPAEIPGLIAEIDTGFDLVSGWKRTRHDPVLTKNLPSKLFNWATSVTSGVRLHDFNCGLKIYRKEVVKSLEFYGEMHRYLPVLAHWNGFRIGEKEVQHHPRKYGVTKYGLNRFVNGFLDLLTITFLRRYTKNPMHLFGLFGILFSLVGFSIIGYFGVQWIVERELHIRPLLLLGVGAILMGIQLFSIGLVGEMITHTGKREEYQVAEKINL